MFLKYRSIPYTPNPIHIDDYGWTIVDIVRQYNGLNGGEKVLDALVERCELMNGGGIGMAQLINEGKDVAIPVLLSEVHKHETGKFQFDAPSEPEPEPVIVEPEIAPPPEPVPPPPKVIPPPDNSAVLVVIVELTISRSISLIEEIAPP